MCCIETRTASIVKELAARESWFGQLSNRFRRAHGVERARHQLRGSRPVQVISRLCLEQLGVGQDDAELVVEAMEEQPQVAIDSWTIGGTARLRAARV